jgi:hypothetical protein
LERFPFEATEWARVKEIALGIPNATLADDESCPFTRSMSPGRAILIEECGRPEEAMRILEQCSRDVEVLADEDEKTEYGRPLHGADRGAPSSFRSF